MEVNQTKQKQDQKTMTDRGLTAEPQAGALKGEIERTKLGEEENPFLRRSKVAHTHQRGKGHSTGLGRISE
jgi:23S rRNA maturation mini-RNase III